MPHRIGASAHAEIKASSFQHQLHREWFSVVDRICQQVKRWQGSDHRLRWVGSALLFAESRWNRIQGYRHMPVLINALNAAYRLRCAHNQAELKAQVRAA